MSKSALIVVDMQNDFVPGGSLAVEGGDTLVPVINKLMAKFFSDASLVVGTQDWHPANHKSFASQYTDLKPFDMVDLHGTQQVLWPDHCVQGTKGAEFCDGLLDIPWIFCKGEDVEVDSYSGFFDNGGKNPTQLDRVLKEQGVERVYVVGLAQDYCVKFTALDAAKLGYETFIVHDATLPVNTTLDGRNAVIRDLVDGNVGGVYSVDILSGAHQI